MRKTGPAWSECRLKAVLPHSGLPRWHFADPSGRVDCLFESYLSLNHRFWRVLGCRAPILASNQRTAGRAHHCLPTSHCRRKSQRKEWHCDQPKAQLFRISRPQCRGFPPQNSEQCVIVVGDLPRSFSEPRKTICFSG